MRVAILIRKWSVRAGNELIATIVADHLHRAGHNVRVFCQRIDRSAEGLLPDDRVIRLPGLFFDPTLAMTSFAMRTRSLVKRLRDRGEVDVVLGFNHSVLQDVYRLGAGTHAEFLAQTKEGGRSGGPLLNWAALKLERIRFRPQSFRHLIAPSEMVQEEILRHYGIPKERVSVIYNGVDLDRFSPTPDPEERGAMRTRWGVGEKERVALFAGQDLKRKGFRVATEAAERAQCRLVYVGKATRPSTLPPWVIWDGEHTEVAACFRSADALLLPTYYEPFGNVLLESMSAGLPVVSTARAGAAELTRNTSLAELIVQDPNDVDGLARALDVAFEETDLRREARTLAERQKLDLFGRAIEQVLKEAVDGN